MIDPSVERSRADLVRTARVRAAYAARRAGLTLERRAALTSAAASHALAGHLLSADELAAGAELLAGRLDVADVRRWLDV